MSERSMSMSVILAFTFGVVFVAALLGFVLAVPNPTIQQFEIIRIILALAAAESQRLSRDFSTCNWGRALI